MRLVPPLFPTRRDRTVAVTGAAMEVQMTEAVVYRSRVRIERVRGPLLRAYLPMLTEPVLFGVHSEIAEHYGVDPSVHEPHAATLDYLVSAAAG